MSSEISLKKSIKQSTLTFILMTTSFILILLSVIALTFIIDSDKKVDEASQARYDLSLNAKRFMEGSAYLTNEVRAYAATGNVIYYKNYIAEVNDHKNRDIAVENMRRIGITAEEELLVAEMSALSDNLIPYEEEAMNLVKAGKFDEAIEAVYGTHYTDWIGRIRSAQSEFIEVLAARTETELEAAYKATRIWSVITVICMGLTAFIQGFAYLVLRYKLILPLLNVRDEMGRIAEGDLHSEFDMIQDTSEMGMLIHSIEETKGKLNDYIAEITDKLASLAYGDSNVRINSAYQGDFNAVKISINRISGILAAQRKNEREQRAELKTAYEEANAANKAKSVFLSNMSHEIRTPLNAILGMTNIALASDDIEKREHCLMKINDASNHLLGVINDILDMSKIDADKFELSSAEFNFEKMMMRVVNIIQFRVDEKKQELRVKMDPKIPVSLIADDQRLAQVITNLLSNAVKFTPENGNIELKAKFIEETGDRCKICISVTDNGIGMTPEQQTKLFSSFTQADAGISRKYGGTGLGLAISKRIVEMMGGRIRVDSEEGNGSKFSFEFYADRGNEAENRPALLSGVKWDTLRVLVADDDPTICEYFIDIGKRYGFKCDAVTDARQALAKMESGEKYDVFFVDWKMPDINGVELTAMIRRSNLGRGVIIMISSAEWSEIESEAREAGVDKFIPKPLFMSMIMDTIAECMGVEVNSESAPQTEELPDFSAYHVLLAEDVEINREILITLLEPTGVDITYAENGQIALDIFKANPDRYNMILMDMQMPEMDGTAATMKIRELEHANAKVIPIVAMTANVFREDVERCLEIGMNDHIGKPLNFDEVIEKMKKYLSVVN